MSKAYLNKRLEERAALADLATGVLDKAAEAGRDPSGEEQTQLDKWAERVKDLDAEIKRLEAMINGNDAFTKVMDRVQATDEAEERRSQRRRERVEVTERPKAVGQRFVESDAFKSYDGRGSSRAVEFENFLVEKRAAITTDVVDVPPYLFTQAGYQLTTPLLNAIGRVATTSGSVEWFTWGGSNAQLVPEGELKPEATIDPTQHTGSLDTYAHYKAISRQALEDIAQIQSIVEGKLRDGLGNALEGAAATVLTTDDQIPVVTNTDLLAGIRQGIGEVQSHAYTPNAIVLNPADYATLDIDAASGAGNGPVGWGSFWGVPAIASGAIPVGEVYVGDFKQGETWFDRNTTAVYMTDSHADFFVRNLLVILAEQRALFAITEPLALAKVTTGAAAPVAAAKASTSK
jgi:HK97 family phage major capsid protein